MALICLITLANVAVRYLTDISFAFTEEISVFLLVFLLAPGSGAITSRVFRRMHHAHPERDTFADDAPVSA